MIKKLISILLVASFLMVVIHDMIPHHHHDGNNIELYAHHHPHNEDQDSFPFPLQHIPPHHHITASENIDIVRLKTGSGINVKPPVFCHLFIFYNFSGYPGSDPPQRSPYPDFIIPLHSLSYIISPNSMRGSPSLA